MFDRFTDRARKALALARKEAQRLEHDFISEAHIFLGLIVEGTGVAANVLRKRIDHQAHQAVERRLPRSSSVQYGQLQYGQLPFTPEAKRSLELAMEESNSLGHNYIGTEHLLLGLLHTRSQVLDGIFQDLQLEREAIRAEVLGFLTPAPGFSGAPLSAELLPPGCYSITDAELRTRFRLEIGPDGRVVIRPGSEPVRFTVKLRLGGEDNPSLEVRGPDGKVLWTLM